MNQPQQSIEQTAAALTAALITLLTPKAAAPEAGAFELSGRRDSLTDAAPAPPAREFDLALEIRQAIGSEMAQIAQAMRLIQDDAEAAPSKPRNVFDLAGKLEETRERVAIAYTLLTEAVDHLDRRYDLTDYVWTPMERACRSLDAMREAQGHAA